MKEKNFRYMLYLQKFNGYWEREPYETLEEIQYLLDTLDENEYWWYLVKDIVLEKTDGYGIVCGGKIHTKEEYKNKPRAKR